MILFFPNIVVYVFHRYLSEKTYRKFYYAFFFLHVLSTKVYFTFFLNRRL